MNEHEDDLGLDADLGSGRDVVKETIGALVDGATPSGVPSAPEQNLRFLRRRVRTWRFAKAGAMGVGSVAVVAALAFGSTQATAWNRSEPLPGRPTVHATDTGPVPSEIPTSSPSPSPTVSASPSPSATPSQVPSATPSGPADVEPEPDVSTSPPVSDPVGAITAPFDDGYRPWSDSYPVWCGMPDEDLVSTSPSVAIEIVGDLSYGRESRTIPIRLTGEMPGFNPDLGAGDTEILGAGAMLIWSQGGRVVDLGIPWAEADYEIPPVLNDTGEWSGVARSAPFSSCVEADKIEDAPAYDNERAAGTYQVRAVQVHLIGDTGSVDSEQHLLFSAPVTVTIP